VETRKFIRITGLALALAAMAFGTTGRATADDEQVKLEVEVFADGSDEPIANASVYVKFEEKRTLRRDKKREWSVKTDAEGKAVFPTMPAGRALVQVVAKGWKSYGRFHELQGPRHILEIKLRAAKKWY